MDKPKRIVLAITGASGSIFGVRLLHMLQLVDNLEIHLLISDAGAINLQHELGMSRQDVEKLASFVHDANDISASIASG